MTRGERPDSPADRTAHVDGAPLLRPPVWFLVVVAACLVVIAATFF